MQPRLVNVIFSDPFAGTSDPLPFRAYEALSINVGIGKKESIQTRADFLVKGFFRSAIVSGLTQ